MAFMIFAGRYHRFLGIIIEHFCIPGFIVLLDFPNGLSLHFVQPVLPDKFIRELFGSFTLRPGKVLPVSFQFPGAYTSFPGCLID
jgi:hypothetical protein